MATDEEVLAQLAPPSDPNWDNLWESVEVWRHDPMPFTWKNIEPGSRYMPWVEFDPAFDVTFGCMVRVGLLLPSTEWRPLKVRANWEDQVSDIAEYSLATCARFLTFIARTDRFSEGFMAGHLENGQILLALDRARSLVAPNWKPSWF
jgi:hypothetical protein